jgi:Tfp pilus assembly protein PilO
MNAFWAQRTAGEKRLIVLCLVVLVVAVPVMLMPPSGPTKKLLTAQEARLKYRETVDQKILLDKDNDRLKPEIEKLVYKEPPDQLLPQAIRTLQAYAKESGIHLREIKPLRAKQTGALTRVPLSIRFTSGFDKTVPFLYRVEDPAGRIVVDKLNVSASDPKTRMVDVEAQVSLFTRAAPAGSGAAAGPKAGAATKTVPTNGTTAGT